MSIFLLLALAAFSVALTQEEKVALKDLAESWDYFRGTRSPWPTDAFDKACDPPYYYGLVCSNDSDPHVTKLYVEK